VFQVKISVLDKNDSPPVFKDMANSLSVSEELAVGQTVTTIKAVDPDTLGQLTYSLVSGDDTKRFQLDSVTGELRLKEPLDRETADTYKVKVRASDGLQFQETTLTIKVGIILFSRQFRIFSATSLSSTKFTLVMHYNRGFNNISGLIDILGCFFGSGACEPVPKNLLAELSAKAMMLRNVSQVTIRAGC
jgi:Cadherin domain